MIMRTLKEISNDAYYNRGYYHQKTVDLIQYAEDLIDNDASDDDEVKELHQEIGALQYEIGVTIEIFNPEFKNEISDLTDLKSILEIYIGKLEANYVIKI